MTYMQLTSEELSSQKWTPERLEQAINQVKLNGFVVLENALPLELVDQLNADFHKTVTELLQKDAAKTEVNTSDFRKNRIRMDIPFREPYTHPLLITNPFALPIVERIVGEDCRMFYYSVDAPMPGADYQTVHGDYMPFYPESDVILPTAGLVVNYPLVTVTEQNGPLEAWPNSHLTPEKFYTGGFVQDAAKQLTPVKMLTPKGALVVRDVRMWHRGTPNVSSEIRPNLALIYARSWWDGAFYPQESLGITKAAHDKLSERAKKLFRFEAVAGM